MKKPNKLYKSLGPKSRVGQAFRIAHYSPVPSLRSAFRGVEWVVAGMFSGATLSKIWVQRFMATMTKMKLPYKGKRLSALFAMMAGSRRVLQPAEGPKLG